MLVGVSTKLAITSLVSSSDRKRETSLLCGAKVSPDDSATLQGHWYCIFIIYYTLTNLRGMTLVLKYFLWPDIIHTDGFQSIDFPFLR